MFSEKRELLNDLIEETRYHKDSSSKENKIHDSQALEIIKVAEDQDCKYGSAQGTILYDF